MNILVDNSVTGENRANHTPEANSGRERRREQAFSLIELLVVMGVMSVVASITLPVLGRIRRKMMATKCMVNTRHLIFAELAYADENDGRFAASYAAICTGDHCDPYYPNTLVNVDSWPREHRNQSEHFRRYLDKADYLDCPEAPGRTPCLQEAWDAGDDWQPGKWLMGTKCFWRNFRGWSVCGEVVEGPRTLFRRGEGKVLVSCVVNYGRNRSSTLMSSGHFKGAHSGSPTRRNNFLWPDFWMGYVPEWQLETAMQSLRLQAGYVDGHVESSDASETMGVWIWADPFLPVGVSYRGKYFLPLGGLRHQR
ncbi:MAG: type II secretion system protein [Planctomycetota bacterium]